MTGYGVIAEMLRSGDKPEASGAVVRVRELGDFGETNLLTASVLSITVFDIASRNMPISKKEISREVLLAFWKVHILHHASEGPLHGQWMLKELNHHGYEISPGTLYPLLARMERLGWLKGQAAARGGKRARKDYRLTAEGCKVLEHVREQICELHEEVVADHRRSGR